MSTTTTVTTGVRTDELSLSSLALQRLLPVQTEAPIIPLSRERLSLGRDEGSDVRLCDDRVSRVHAEIVRDGPSWVAYDLNSTNGLFVNGCRCRQAPLTPGTLLRLGNSLLLVTSGAGAQPHIGLREVAPGMLGGERMAEAMTQLERVARSDLSVVIHGETGTGKELVARALHTWSAREGPLVAVNCAAIPESLAEAQFFGHVRGAFTGAHAAREGWFRDASQGTLLLDEIAELSKPMQAMLLRVLENREVVPVGETRPIPIDVRVVCASHKLLANEVLQKRFRADLHMRLNGMTVDIPPLRERVEDIAPLFLRLLETHSAGHPPVVSGEVMERLCLHPFPGNVRELLTLAKRLAVLCDRRARVRLDDLPQELRTATGAAEVPPLTAEGLSARCTPRRPRQDETDRAALLIALERSGGNVKEASAAVGLSRQRAYRLLRGHPAINLEALRLKAQYGACEAN